MNIDFTVGIPELEKKIEYKFENKEILELALTHSSFANELKTQNKHLHCNERLEFLGDSILSLVTSEYIFGKFPDLPEGELTKIRADAVCEDALADYAAQISLGKYLHLGRGEDLNGGRDRKSICSDAFEALIAAIYTDAAARGYAPFSTAKKFVLPFIIGHVRTIPSDGALGDCKTKLQQLVQQGGEVLEYVVVDETGPDHKKIFTVEAHLNSNVIGRGKGTSKREAEQAAAHEALLLFGENA